MSTKPTLYDVSAAGLEMQRILEENDGDLTPELEQQLDALMAAGTDRIEAAAMVVKRLELEMRSIEAFADAMGEEQKRIFERAARIENSANRLKARMANVLDSVFSGKVKTPLFTCYVQQGATTLHIEAPEESLESMPEEYVVTKRQLNKRAIAEWYEKGELLPKEITVTEIPGNRGCRIR